MLTPRATQLDLDGPLAHFAEHGYARLGPVLCAAGIASLRAQTKALMSGTLHYDELYYQHDAPSGQYTDLRYLQGWAGPSHGYRKLEGLQVDPIFRDWIENGLFERIARRLIGPSVSLYRAVLWNKAARAGTELPWHQDDGKFWGIDRAPTLQIWTALDDAPAEAGCLEVIPGSHRGGLASAEGGTVQAHCLEAANAQDQAVKLPADAGEAILVHNHLWHRSGRNRTPNPRRAFSVSYLDGATRCLRRKRAPRQFLPLFCAAQRGTLQPDAAS